MLDKQSLIDELERLIDSQGLKLILNAMAEVCHLKAEHLRSNWQDEANAKGWERDAARIETCSRKVEV